MRLEREGVMNLDDAQRAAVTRYHDELLAGFGRSFDIDRNAKSKQLSLGMRIASFIGALALASSVFFLFYQFWGYFSTPVQAVILVTAAMGSFLAATWIDQRDGTGYFAKVAAFVSFACFALNIFMLGQIFNITASDKALLPLAAFALLLAYGFDSRLLQAAGILCLIAFIAARVGSQSGMYWFYFGERPENFFPAAVAIFLVPQFVSHARFSEFAPLYRIFGMLGLFLPMLMLANWGQSSYLDLDRHLIEGFYQALGILGTAALIWHGARNRWSDVVNTGVTLFTVFLYTRLFDWWWDAMPKYLFFLLTGLTAILLLIVLRRLRKGGA